MASFTTTDFLSSVRMRGSIPTSTNTNNVNSTTNLLALATEELHIKLLPMLMATREEFYVKKKDFAITQGQANYPIPSRASGMVLRDAQVIWGASICSLPMIEVEKINTTTPGIPVAYYLEHNNVVLYPTPSSTIGTLRLRYFLRPSRLAATSACAQISAINTLTNTVTVNAVPSNIVTGTTIDFVRAAVPYDNPAIDQTVLSVSGTDLNFAALPSDLVVGDWVALADYSPIPQIPQEFQPVLAQMTVVKALEALGDANGAASALKDLQTIQQAALMLITPRNQGENRKIVANRWRR